MILLRKYLNRFVISSPILEIFPHSIPERFLVLWTSSVVILICIWNVFSTQFLGFRTFPKGFVNRLQIFSHTCPRWTQEKLQNLKIGFPNTSATSIVIPVCGLPFTLPVDSIIQFHLSDCFWVLELILRQPMKTGGLLFTFCSSQSPLGIVTFPHVLICCWTLGPIWTS